ncbi:MAG: 16S rRNA (cytidine(1402)-2'-O)-methyltransferase [Proteobacteria bacterium]|nr:16S rRNA (cytidine(1402)-2'-O)-methyltransferase [Pseudomonadota bacterium]
MESSFGVLYIVATPIGNLGDITQRALKTLQEVDFIAAEDTRHSQHLLQHFGIQNQLLSLHDYNETERLSSFLKDLKEGKNIALISDAGTPLISDPGYKLVEQARKAGIRVVPIPGACAAIAALSAAGLPCESFIFEGFLPEKTAARKKQLSLLQDETRTLVFYESPHRVLDMIKDLLETLGSERRVVLARELTKTFETFHQTTLGELPKWLDSDPNQLRGEFVILVEGTIAKKQEGLNAESERVLKLLLSELPLKQAVNLAMKITGEKKNSLYQSALNLVQ